MGKMKKERLREGEKGKIQVKRDFSPNNGIDTCQGNACFDYDNVLFLETEHTFS